MRTTILIAMAILAFSPPVADADTIVAEFSGLSGTDAFEDFGANLFPNFTPVSTEFAGLTIVHARYFTTGTSNNLVGGFLTNDFDAGPPNTLSITFDQNITDLSFVYHQVGSGESSVFRALLDGVVVETFSNESNQSQPNNYFGFTDIVFNELQLDFVSDFNVDSLAYNFATSLLGDVNLDGVVNLLDVAPFVELLSNAGFQIEADINQDGIVNLLDVEPFIAILNGG